MEIALYVVVECVCVGVIFVMEFFEFYVIMSLREIFKWNCGTHIIQILKKLKE